MSEEPRAYTADEMRKIVIDHLCVMARYWVVVDLSRPEFADEVKKEGEVLYRLNGLLHSVLVMFDGCSSLPAFDLVPRPHPTDEVYHRENGENWWDSIVINNDCHLHDMLYVRSGS